MSDRNSSPGSLPNRFERPALPTDPAGLPPLPVEFAATLVAGLDGLRLDLPPDVLANLDAFSRLLLAWTAAINLTAIREPVAVARDHLLDSLSAVRLLRAAGARRVLDLGSGGGLPGIPIALALPDARVLLVESIGKKARFLETAVTALGLQGRVRVAAARAEEIAVPGRERGRWDAVLVRAVAELGELVELALPLLSQGGLLVAWKRDPVADEVRRAAGALAALGGRVVEIVPAGVAGLEEHRLVVVRKLRPTPARFPRTPADRRRQPL
jgi:16S rRNA (guanine527-N7)-methyltransferase